MCDRARVELARTHYPGGFTLTRRGGLARKRRVHVLCTGLSSFRFGVHNANVDTAFRGILERVYLHKLNGVWQPPHQPLEAELCGILEPVVDRLKDLAKRRHPWTRDQFVASFRGRKQALYQRAADSLARKPLSVKDSFLSTFVKAEKLNVTLKPDPSPRVIQPRSPRFNLCIGVYIKAIELQLYHDLDQMISRRLGCDAPCVMKGLNAVERARVVRQLWDQLSDPVYIAIDAHRMDQHLSSSALRWIHRIYMMYCDHPIFKKLLRWQIQNRGFVRCRDGTIKYKVEGRGMSGDMDTSLRNIVIMVCLFVALFLHLDLPCRLINDGDDNGVFSERKHHKRVVEALPQFFERAGFVMEIEQVVDVFEHIDFCQTRPVWDGTRWVMCRDPRIVLSKDSYSIKSIENESAWNTQRKSVSECGLSLAGNLPVLGQYYAMLGRGAGDKVDAMQEETGFARLARGVDAKLAEPTYDCRASFFRAFGISPDVQVDLERQFAASSLRYTEQAAMFDLSSGLFGLLRSTHGVV